MNIKLIIKLILVVVVCAAGFFGYRYFFGDSVVDQVTVTKVGQDGVVVSDQQLDNESQQFLSLLVSVQNVGDKLKENFVQDPFFKKLQDYTVPVTPKPISRANPFLPIGVGGRYVETDLSVMDLLPAVATTTEAIATTTEASSTPNKTSKTIKATSTTPAVKKT